MSWWGAKKPGVEINLRKDIPPPPEESLRPWYNETYEDPPAKDPVMIVLMLMVYLCIVGGSLCIYLLIKGIGVLW